MKPTKSFSVAGDHGVLSLDQINDGVGRPTYLFACSARPGYADFAVELTDPELRLLIQAAAAVIR